LVLKGKERTKGHDPIDCYVGNQIRERRMARGMSQTVLGDALGITFQQVQKYEKGLNRVSASRLHRLAEVLQVAPTFFFDEQLSQMCTVSSGTDDLDQFLASAEGSSLMKAFQRVSGKKLRRSIVALVQRLARDRAN
jgi:transcriptional regulator with XRE-family HTH domain